MNGGDGTIRIGDYPQLSLIAWSVPGRGGISEEQAWGLYERHWDRVDEAALTPAEADLVRYLADRHGKLSWMFERPSHQGIAGLLRCFDPGALLDADCYLAGGAAIVPALDGYRETGGVDFLCASREGCRRIREAVRAPGLGGLLARAVEVVREVRTEMHRAVAVLAADGVPVRVRFDTGLFLPDVSGGMDERLGVPVASREDLFAGKLLANADTYPVRALHSRDAVDLAMMAMGWGDVPAAAWEKAGSVYGAVVARGLRGALGLLSDREYLSGCLEGLAMDPGLASDVVRAFGRIVGMVPPGMR